MGREFSDNGYDNKRSVVVSTVDKELNNETSRAIRKVMETIERYTNYDVLDVDIKDIVRDTVLNQINRLVRVAKHKQVMAFTKDE
jgi:hypothetical protein